MNPMQRNPLKSFALGSALSISRLVRSVGVSPWKRIALGLRSVRARKPPYPLYTHAPRGAGDCVKEQGNPA